MAGEKQVTVIWGPTGTGKTREVWERECGPDTYDEDKLYVVADKYWWDGYNGQEAVLFDEFVGETPIEWILKVTDRYPMRAPIKGGFVPLKIKRVYFTSNKSPMEWWPQASPQQLDAFFRRVTEEIQK